MQSFESYVGQRDNLQEGPLDWVKNKLWGERPASPPPPTAPRAARVLTPSQQTVDPRPNQGRARLAPMSEQPPTAGTGGIPNRLDPRPNQGRARLAPMSEQPPTAGTGGIPNKQERVKFTANDLLNVKNAIADYHGLVQKFLSKLKWELAKVPSGRGAEAKQFASATYKKYIKPKYEMLQSWQDWIDKMIAQLPKRESVEEEEDLIIEAIQVNYKNFEQMAGAIRNLTGTMEKWLDALGQRMGPNFQQWMRKEFVTTVAAKQRDIDKQFTWLAKKIQDLMAIHGKEYQRPTAAQAQYANVQPRIR